MADSKCAGDQAEKRQVDDWRVLQLRYNDRIGVFVEQLPQRLKADCFLELYPEA